MYQYNPGYNRWSTDPAGPHRLVMPIDVADQFVAALSHVPAADRVRWKRHKVKSGEAISQIAEQLQHDGSDDSHGEQSQRQYDSRRSSPDDPGCDASR